MPWAGGGWWVVGGHLPGPGSHLGSCTLTVPMGTISRDLPQNLFFHLMSGGVRWEEVRPPPAPSLVCVSPAPHPNTLFQHPPCQKTKLSDSAWQAEMGGWWQTWWEKKEKQKRDTPPPRRAPFPSPLSPAPPFPRPHLLADETEPTVGPHALVGLAQHRVEGFAARPVVGGGVGGHGEGGHVNLSPQPPHRCHRAGGGAPPRSASPSGAWRS